MSTFREMYLRSQQQQQSQAARPRGLGTPAVTAAGSSQPSLSQCFSQPGAFSQDDAVSPCLFVRLDHNWPPVAVWSSIGLLLARV